METDPLAETEAHMHKSVEALQRELATIRTGRANPQMIEHLSVEYYGSPTPLQQLAAITSPDPRQLLIQPYDRSVMGDIEKAIRSSDLGFNPTNDGSNIRVIIPQLTEERRREFVKLVGKRVEEAKIAVRNVRRDSNERLRKLKKDKELSEDDEKRALERLQKVTDRAIADADAVGRAKEAEIMEV